MSHLGACQLLLIIPTKRNKNNHQSCILKPNKHQQFGRISSNKWVKGVNHLGNQSQKYQSKSEVTKQHDQPNSTQPHHSATSLRLPTPVAPPGSPVVAVAYHQWAMASKRPWLRSWAGRSRGQRSWYLGSRGAGATGEVGELLVAISG